jgi:flagellar basal body-associated protein FliL
MEGKRKLAADIVASINAIVAPGSAQNTPAAKADEGDAKPAAAADANPEEDAKPAAEAGETPAAAESPALPVHSVLFTSFIVQ